MHIFPSLVSSESSGDGPVASDIVFMVVAIFIYSLNSSDFDFKVELLNNSGENIQIFEGSGKKERF